MEIKKAKEENLKDIQKLNHQLCIKENEEFDKTINKDYPIQKKGEEYFRERITNGCVLIAVIKNKIIGYLAGAIVEAEDYRNISKLAETENMFVLPEFRSKGVGKKLLDEFISWCKSKKANRIKTVASIQNKESINFYKREGFKDYNLELEKELL
jgi:GNAT superfamily N-acetyltransferase